MTATSQQQVPFIPFPYLATDYLMGILSPAEWVCFSYIIRRTRGFVAEDGGRKQTDVISLDQFENGIVRKDGRVLDLGTGLTRPTIKKALDELADKGLTVTRLACTRANCGWLQGEHDEPPPPAGKAKSPSCPNCRKSLSFSYGMAKLSARTIEVILNRHDPKGRAFTWNTEARGYEVEIPEEAERRRQKDEDLRAEAARLRTELWYPDLVDECVKQAESVLKAGNKISPSRVLEGFYRPVVKLQETFVSFPLLKYALEETIRQKIPAGRRSQRWFNYTTAICENNKAKYAGAPKDAGTNATQAKAESIETLEQAVRDMLHAAADLNGRGETEPARKLLSDILAQSHKLAPLFNGDAALADISLREAFKQGAADFVGIEPDQFGFDFFHDKWSWPEDVQTPSQRRRESDRALRDQVAG
jgi:hypothetical protein